MAYKPEVLRNYRTGLQKNREPFIIEQDAFAQLFNAYVWRGRIKKKKGTQLLARLARVSTAVSIGNTGASPWTINTIFTASGVGASDTNKDMIAGSVVITIAGPIVFTDQGNGTLTSVTAGNSGTINYATGEIVLTHTAGAGVATTATFRYAPSRPVMGLPYRFLKPINEEQLYAFDTRYAYIFSNFNQAFEEAPSTVPTIWTGTSAQQFWPMNAYNALWVTNGVKGLQAYNVTDFAGAVAGPPAEVTVTTATAHNLSVGDQVIFVNVSGGGAPNNGLRGTVIAPVLPTVITIQNPDSTATNLLPWTNAAGITGKMIVANQNVTAPPVTTSGGDGIRWHDGVNWINFNPVLTPTTALMGAKMIFFYRGRIVVLNTLEGASTGATTEYSNRARYSQLGTPFDILPVPTGSGAGTDYQAWRQDVPGKGGFIDAPTNEEIVSAYFLRDILVVAFENSSWKLQYTNNRILPFVWERLNTELGADSQFSAIPFDKQVLFIGPRGIIANNGVGVDRIDTLVPDFAFDFRNTNSGPERISGIRDYEEQVVMWTLPNNQTPTGVFPNEVLLYNYVDGSWGVFGDSFTCYGYWQPFNDVRWQDLNNPLEDLWRMAQFSWAGTETNVGTQQVIAGNQLGFVSKVLFQTSNDVSLKVNAVTVVALSPTELTVVTHNLVSGAYVYASGFLGANAVLNGQVFNVTALTADTIALYKWNSSTGTLGAYDGGSATYTGNGKLSVIDNFTVLTKQFNPFLDAAVQVRMKEIEFYVDATANGRFVVNLYVNDNNNQPANPTSSENSLSNRVETFANPYENATAEKLWHSLFGAVTGTSFQIECTYDDEELNTPAIFESEVVIHSIAPQSTPAAKRLS